MTPLRAAAAVTVVFGAGVAALARGVRRPSLSIAQVRDRMYGSTDGVTERHGWVGTLAAGGPGRWIQTRLGTGLASAGLTVTDVVTRVAVGASVVAFAALATTSALVAAGMLPLSPLWLVLVLGVAALAAVVMWSDVCTKVERSRRELRQAANDLVQLVAVGLTTDQSIEEAIRFAIDVGGDGAFQVLRVELDAAPMRGLQVWEALRALSRMYGIRELDELANAVERQGTQGVSIASSVATLAASMRAAALDELEREADRANANLSGPTIGFVIATVVFLAYPLALRVSEAFSG